MAVADLAMIRLPGLKDTGLKWLLAALTSAVLPHVLRTPVWIPLLYAALVFWCLAGAGRRKTSGAFGALSSVLKLIVGIVIVFGIFASYDTLTGRDAGVALLILLAGMKLVELRSIRDYYIVILIGLFLLLTNFFYTQTPTSAAYMVASVTVFFAAMLAFNDVGAVLDTRARLRVAGSMVIQALPLMLVMFLLFPRISGPLWGLPRDARSAITGLDDEMSPGSIARVSLSDQVAFRVEFNGDIPPRRELYWRGPVLTFTDGVKWVTGRLRSGRPPVQPIGTPVEYTITMEPTQRRWLYSLDLADEAPPHSSFTEDMQIRTRRPVDSRVRYTLQSHTDYRLLTPDREQLEQALQLPPGSHPRTLALARSWKTKGLNTGQVVRRALAMFHDEPFFYTLTPPPLLADTIDEFLFETRRGFCEHYAAAFVVLMRAAGIPARVVTGYQGGEINPIGNYLIVRERDAHAWAEVWMGDRGWVRVDPTAAVAPARVLQGIDSALPDSVVSVPLAFQDNAMARDLWEQVRYSLDALNNDWNQWVLGYDQNRQFMFLRRIGLGWLNTQELGAGLVIVVSLGLLAVAGWLFKGIRHQADPARRLYDRFCARLARRGTRRLPQEGPRNFARRAATSREAVRGAIEEITDLYIAVRYAGHAEKLPELRRAVKAFHP